MSFSGATDTPVFDFWWRLLWGSDQSWQPYSHLAEAMWRMFTSGATAADLLATSMAAEPFSSTYLWTVCSEPPRPHGFWYIVGAGSRSGRNSCRTWTGRGFTGTFVDVAGGAEPGALVVHGGGRTTQRARGRGRLRSTHGHSTKRHVATDLWLHYSYSQVSPMPFSLNSLGSIHTKRKWEREPKKSNNKQQRLKNKRQYQRKCLLSLPISFIVNRPSFNMLSGNNNKFWFMTRQKVTFLFQFLSGNEAGPEQGGTIGVGHCPGSGVMRKLPYHFIQPICSQSRFWSRFGPMWTLAWHRFPCRCKKLYWKGYNGCQWDGTEICVQWVQNPSVSAQVSV